MARPGPPCTCPNLLPHGPGSDPIGGVFISFKDIFVVVAAAILVALLAVFINRSKLGQGHASHSAGS